MHVGCSAAPHIQTQGEPACQPQDCQWARSSAFRMSPCPNNYWDTGLAMAIQNPIMKHWNIYGVVTEIGPYSCYSIVAIPEQMLYGELEGCPG